MPVLSDPAAVFFCAGQSNATCTKLAKECTCLSLADKGLQQLCGVERFHNLSVLVLSKNKLTKIDHLDSNFRIRVLIAHGNQLCTLKGSLVHMKHLQELDLSNNQLRNLQKIKSSLECFEFLENLNLMGNPVCEEADYRFTLIDAIGSLAILDCHTVTTIERKQATECMRPGPPLQVGFGSTVPPHMGTEYVARESFHELKAYQEVKAMHERQAAEAQLAANVLPNTHGFPPPPFPDFPPPPPGWYVKKEPEDQPVQPSCQEGASEACSRRDVYLFNTMVKPMSNSKALEEAASAGTIRLDPGAYREFALKQALRNPLQLQPCSIRI